MKRTRITVMFCAILLTVTGAYSQVQSIPPVEPYRPVPPTMGPTKLIQPQPIIQQIDPTRDFPGSGPASITPPQPPPPIEVPHVQITRGDDDLTKLRHLLVAQGEIERYLGDASKAQEAVGKSRDAVIAVTAVDPTGEIGKLVVERLEKQAVAEVSGQLASQLDKQRKDVYDWGVNDNSHTWAQRQTALATIAYQEGWVNRVAREAIDDSNSRTNQKLDSGDSSQPTASFGISASPSATTSRIKLSEGAALRQLRDVAKNGWSGVLSARR